MNRVLPCCLVVSALVGLAGCVERELKITSQPEGAIVYVSDVEVGRTPVTIPFTFYGDYDIILRRDGYETLKTHAYLSPPVYELPPLDLLSAMAPWTYHDRRHVHFDLEPYVPTSDEDLIRRAEQMKRRNLEPVD